MHRSHKGLILFQKPTLFMILLFACTSMSAKTIAGETLKPTKPELRQPWEGTQKRTPDVIYGTDDRIDVYQETNPDRVDWARSTCGLFYADDVINNGNGTYDISLYAYSVSGYPACSSEPFADQPVSPICSGFLVAPDIIATAGHCFESGDESAITFVFGFEMQNASTPVETVSEDNVYFGIELLGRMEVSNGADYAVIRVDRPVVAEGATPLPIRRNGTIANNTRVGVIGHPAGLPTKIAFGDLTVVRDSSPSGYFITNLDTYGGNSGSAVFNAETGVVEGILVRGDDDYVLEGSCFVSNVNTNTGGSGEDVTKTTVFADLIPGTTLTINKDYYLYGDSIVVTLDNPDIDPVFVEVTTYGESDVEQLTLTDPDSDSIFTGSLPLGAEGDPVVQGDGILQGADLDIIRIRYTATSSTDNQELTVGLGNGAPNIYRVELQEVGTRYMRLTALTNVPTTMRLDMGETCGTSSFSETTTLDDEHEFSIEGLSPCTEYFLSLTATGAVSNSSTNDNNGNCFSFKTLEESIAFTDNFDSPVGGQPGWTHAATGGADNWATQSSAYASDGPTVYGFIPGNTVVTSARLVSPAIESAQQLTFYHSYDLEDGYDGAVLEISTNDGASWQDLGDYIISGGYTDTIAPDYNSPIANRSAWTGEGFTAPSLVRVDLSSFQGPFRLGFRFACDESVDSGGWVIDQLTLVQIKLCINEANPSWIDYP